MPKKSIHVMREPNGWAVEREGTRKPLSMHRTQLEAERAGRELAKRNKTDFMLHGRAGDIRRQAHYSR